MIQRVLAEDLRQRLPLGRVALPGDPTPDKGVSELAVTIVRFMPDAGGRVVLVADWSLRAGSNGASPTQSAAVSVPASAGTQDIVVGMSQALGKLADQIAASASAC